MCGIAGMLQLQPDAQADSEVLRRMCAAMVHRGPDDEGIYAHGSAGLGVRRLSIIDLATGHQPISNEDGSLWIVLNGEIYNHCALRERLAARGHRFRTRCDTEVIVHLYEEYGRDCVEHLHGMFAFAIWDEKKRVLFAARDRLGIKPLYYRLTSHLFLLGSEIKVLLAHPDVQAEFRRDILSEYLAFGYLSGPETFYREINKLMPGHWLEIGKHGNLQSGQYWDLPVAEGEAVGDESFFVQQYRSLLEEAVESHLMSDVPLGVFLSGGVDSSAVAALATSIRKSPIETFSVGYAEQHFSELAQARVVAKHLQSTHHEVLVSQKQFFDHLPKLIWQEDEPMAWPSSVALYFVARLARERVVVVLTGEGSDETLAGYARYSATRRNFALDRLYRGVVPAVLRKKIQESISETSWMGSDPRRKLEHTFLVRNGEGWTSFYFDNFFSAFSEPEQAQLLSKDALCELEAGASYRRVLGFWEQSSGSMLRCLLCTDIKTYLVELLMKQDSMSMAASVESRVPFLDHKLVEFALSIPEQFLVRGLAGKQVLKKAVSDLLPHSVLHRKKLGFPTPWAQWLMGRQLETIQKLLMEKRSLDRNLFDPRAVEKLFNEHRTCTKDHKDRIWRLLNLELWHRVCLEGDPHDARSAELGERSFHA